MKKGGGILTGERMRNQSIGIDRERGKYRRREMQKQRDKRVSQIEEEAEEESESDRRGGWGRKCFPLKMKDKNAQITKKSLFLCNHCRRFNRKYQIETFYQNLEKVSIKKETITSDLYECHLFLLRAFNFLINVDLKR